MQSKKRVVWIVAVLVLLGVAAFAGWRIWEIKRAVVVEAPSPSPIPSLSPSPSPTPSPTPTPSPSASPSPSPKVILQSILDLRSQHNNEDIVGYLSIPGTMIDYAITQSADNEFYLEHNIDKKEEFAGWPFMDYENDPVADEDWNTIIYGHNMNKDIMFHSLRYYVNEEFYQEHRYVVYTGLYEKQLWEVYAFYVADVSLPEALKFNYIQVNFDDYVFFEKLVTEMKSRSFHDTGIAIEEGDRILSLSTCTNGKENERFVLSLTPVKDMTAVPQEIQALLAE